LRHARFETEQQYVERVNVHVGKGTVFLSAILQTVLFTWFFYASQTKILRNDEIWLLFLRIANRFLGE
jgi:hypothetical protein